MYFAHARAQARFFAWYNMNCAPLLSGKTDQMERCFSMFPWDALEKKAEIFNHVRPLGKQERDIFFFLNSLSDPGMQGMIWSSAQPPNIAEGFVQLCEDFIRKDTWHTFPREWTTKEYLDRFFGETKEMSPYLNQMAWYTSIMPEYWTLAHPNAMIDNAFYWRDGDGVVQCGMLDWGGCSHMPMTRSLAGCWIAAEPALMDEYEDGLLRCFLDEYEKCCGLKLDYDEMTLHLRLGYIDIHVGNCASVRWCQQITKREGWAWKDIADRYDGKIDDGFMMRCYYVQTEYFLGMWKKRNPYPYFQEFMRRTGLRP